MDGSVVERIKSMVELMVWEAVRGGELGVTRWLGSTGKGEKRMTQVLKGVSSQRIRVKVCVMSV